MSARKCRPSKPQFERVYFVGAGFTACQGYPLGGQLVVRLARWLEQQAGSNASKHYRSKAREIHRQIGVVLRDYLRVPARKVDVAEFYTLIQMMSETPGVFQLGPGGADLAALNESVSAATGQFFVLKFHERAYLAPRPSAILDKVDPTKHAVVNFNWDEEVDWFLTKNSSRGDEVAYTWGSWLHEPTERPFLLLKPHGSTGWFDISEGIRNADAYLICEHDPRISRRDCRIVSFLEVETPRRLRGDKRLKGLDCPRVITAPTFAKKFAHVEQQCVWQDVIDVCSNATKFVFLGYSLPPDDYLTRAAIRNALRRHSGPRGGKICCLVLTKADRPDQKDYLLSNFQSVFGRNLALKRNFLFCDFRESRNMRQAKRFAARMEERLEQATIGSPRG